jgi:glyoxylase-like metal-dependent hydrolase (beta-lactamase superfamily II)
MGNDLFTVYRFLIMKLFLISAMCIAAISVFSSALAQSFKVVAIDESPGQTMKAETFSSADPEAVKKYMPEGNAPASRSSFVLFAGKDTVLIDTGAGADAWFKKLTDLGIKPESVKLILITHFHPDHIGGLFQGDARRFPHAKVLASTPEYDSQGAPFEKIKAVYGGNFVKFNFDDEVFANPLVKVKALDASGHTPGHAVFLIEAKQKEEDKLLIIGDLLHAAALQFPVPEACASYDMDREKAVAARKRILDFAAQEKILIGGMHLPPPSIGTVKKLDKGYTFELVK